MFFVLLALLGTITAIPSYAQVTDPVFDEPDATSPVSDIILSLLEQSSSQIEEKFAEFEQSGLEIPETVNSLYSEGLSEYQEALDFLFEDKPKDLTDKELMEEILKSVRGTDDNFVSPDDYKEGKAEWFAKGLSKESYDKNFQKFANPAHLEDYEIGKDAKDREVAEAEEVKEPLNFDEMSKIRAKDIQGSKDRGTERKTAETQLIAQLKADLGLGKSDDLPKQYKTLVDDIMFAVFGKTFGQKIIPGGKGGFFGTSQDDARKNLNL